MRKAGSRVAVSVLAVAVWTAGMVVGGAVSAQAAQVSAASRAEVELLTPQFAAALKAEAEEKAAAGVIAPAACGNVAWTSAANAKYVSVEVSYTGRNYAMLRARASTIGPWEKFTFCYNDAGDYFTLKSLANNLYVTAELSYTGLDYGMLRARASSIGPWEKFDYLTAGGLPIWWNSKANGRYVMASVGYGGSSYAMLRAASTDNPINGGLSMKWARPPV